MSAKCKECGKVAKFDTVNSNDNWEVYNTTCEYCGGKVEIDVPGLLKSGYKKPGYRA